MGWKALKEAFGIGHLVHVTPKGICIGSGESSDIVTIDTQTGGIHENETFSGFLRQHYPTLRDAFPEEILKLIETPDTFSAAIPVFTYEGAEIIEKLCEAPGWPNVTHDGCLMDENRFSTEKTKVIAWAKRYAKSAVVSLNLHILRMEIDLAKAQDALEDWEANRIQLETTYPSASEQIVHEHKFRKNYPTLAKMVDMLLEKHNSSDPQAFQKVSPGRNDLKYFWQAEQYCFKRTAWDLEALCFGREGCCDKRGVDVYYQDDCVLEVPHLVYPVIDSIRNSIEKLSGK